MAGQYGHLIGILGLWGAGKTSLLSSLYLMAAHGELAPDFIFAGSKTLQGFDDRARRLRRWSGGVLPDQLADHTYLSDPRSPALMHLAIKETAGKQRRLDLLLTDLPGEWSKNLVDRADAAPRFAFLKRADGVVLVVDGPLMCGDSRHSEFMRAKRLAQRLAETVQLERSTPIVLAVSKCDEIGMVQPELVLSLAEYITGLGFAVNTVLTSAFSSVPDKVKNGTGVIEMIKMVVNNEDARKVHPVSSQGGQRRMFERFRLRGV